MSDNILQMEHIVKVFPGVRALDDVTFGVKRGEIHALVGENGAGKSTLMKVLTGNYPYGTYEGNIIINDKEQRFRDIKDSEKAGIAIIYQELALCKNMTVTESIFLGEEIKKGWGLLDWNEMNRQTAELLKQVDLNISPDTQIINLGVGQQQMIEICKAIRKNAKLLVLDEPTAALTESETNKLLLLLEEMRDKGVTCIYISHKLDEVFRISDTITVLRDGKTIMTMATKDMTKQSLIAHMVGRDLEQMYPKKVHQKGDLLLSVRNWTVAHPELKHKNILEDISFDLYRGEIVGIAGLMGAGRTELFMSLIGEYGSNPQGTVTLEGKEIHMHSCKEAINYGIGYVSEDRKRYGLVLDQDIKFNVGMASLEKYVKKGLIDNNRLVSDTEKYVHDLEIKTPSIEQKTKNLSGGNQQKVVLGKWLMTNPKVLILDEPTRGIDVGAKVEIYNIMNDLVDQGVGIIMVSSELPEVMGMSDRILIMNEGKFVMEFHSEEVNQEKMMYYMTGEK